VILEPGLDADGLLDKMNPMSAGDGRRAETLKAMFFWGTLWGIWEATAGHAAHFIRVPGLPGFIMFPAAFFFMSRVFLRSQGTSQGGGTESPGKARSPFRRGQPESIVMAACIAASIKLLDVFIPAQNIQAVVNPAQAILLESLAVAGFYACLGRLAETCPQKIKR
jgi:hypothetical protein